MFGEWGDYALVEAKSSKTTFSCEPSASIWSDISSYIGLARFTCQGWDYMPAHQASEKLREENRLIGDKGSYYSRESKRLAEQQKQLEAQKSRSKTPETQSQLEK